METKREKIKAIFKDLRDIPGTPSLAEAEDKILAILDGPLTANDEFLDREFPSRIDLRRRKA